jgi:hypothetical protein
VPCIPATREWEERKRDEIDQREEDEIRMSGPAIGKEERER